MYEANKYGLVSCWLLGAHLMELAQVSGIHGLITEYTVNGEVLAGLEGAWLMS